MELTIPYSKQICICEQVDLDVYVHVRVNIDVIVDVLVLVDVVGFDTFRMRTNS
jgi:hypothetical protein